MTSRWRGLPTITHHSDTLSVTTVPARGAKIISIRWKASEWLSASGGVAPSAPGTDFVDAELCGWDECAPSILPCSVNGQEIPDHGDVWDAEWSVVGDALEVNGIALPYRLRRRISVGDSWFRLEYQVAAYEGPVPFLWAAHPQFLAPPGTRVDIDPVPDRVLEVNTGTPRWQPWRPDLGSIDTVTRGTGRKIFLAADAPINQVRLTRGDGGCLALSWTTEVARFLGIWFDAGQHARTPVIAPEPTTGWYDSLHRANEAGRVLQLPAGSTRSWTLEGRFSEISER